MEVQRSTVEASGSSRHWTYTYSVPLWQANKAKLQDVSEPACQAALEMSTPLACADSITSEDPSPVRPSLEPSAGPWDEGRNVLEKREGGV